ncbi:DUF5694 domain-containing protein [Pontibacter litorisediminis]|uniref:DUF5694 domain-containing protein n=1 Tax=Pontibacter litorisediminis TaxID=1846260 RepID=UPI0023EABD80|nr:DUF5694 domain-containing protein [Pontibacter litorisediminis]
MRNTVLLLLPLLWLASCKSPEPVTQSAPVSSDSSSKVQIMMLGVPHFSQLQEEESRTSNFLSPQRQDEIAEVNKLLLAYAPDMIMIEREPLEQAKYDSLLSQFKNGRIHLERLEGGAGEVYQFAFKLAKAAGHDKVYCIDHFESTSQSLLSTGDNIEIFEKGLKQFQLTARGITADFKKGDMTFREFLVTLNEPETIALSHRQLYNLPAYVQNGSFRSYQGLNRSEVDTTQIGAELISLFYERNLKIYSNILNAQLKYKGKRILLIMGQTHVGVLQDIIENNPNYEIRSVNHYLSGSEV